MEITWYGLSCFRIAERGMATIVADPYGDGLGLPKRKLRADVVTISHGAKGHSQASAVKGVSHVLTSPGEYEIGGVFITAVAMGDPSENGGANLFFLYDYDGVNIAHLGDLNKVPSQSQVEDLAAVDVALVPVGGGAALTPAQAAEVISIIEPSIIVPMHFKTGKEKVKLGGVEPFLSEMGISEYEPLESLKVTKSALNEETQVVVLQVAPA
jgi:L-ascorbate metabolism protein UlaG (beta-lactamase superfamily)